MKLIYLDTSNFSLLSEVQQKFPERLKSFLKTWRDNNYILALSETNIFEIARKGFNESRYRLLKEFRPIRFESAIFPKEIIKALKRKSIYNFLINDYHFCRPMFYEAIFSNEQLHYLCDSTQNGYQSLANRGYELSEISWQSKKNFSVPKNTRKLRIGDLSDSPSDIISVALRKYIEKIINTFEEGREEHPGMERLKFLHSRLEEVGPQQVFAELARIDTSKRSNLNKSFNTVSEQMLFKDSVAYFLSQMLYDSKERVNFLASKVSIEDCPGKWLEQQIEFHLEKSGDFETSNQLDIKHISHLPYVDLLITDKRIVDKTIQVFRSNNLLNSLKKVALPKKVSKSIESLEEALFN